MKMLNHTGRFVLLLSSAAMLLTACGSKVLDFRNAEINNGKVYAGDSNTPFSGKLTNAPIGTILGSQQGFIKARAAIKNTLPMAIEGILEANLGMDALCDVQVSDGMLDGKTICRPPRTDVDQIVTNFSGGSLDGTIVFHDPTGKNTFAEMAFKNGEPDGKMKVYNPTTWKLAHLATWDAGTLNGEEEGYDETTGNRILHATLDHGKYSGEYTRYAPDGKQITFQTTYVQGLEDGVEKAFDPVTGKLTGEATVSAGKLNGEVRHWNTSGDLILDENFQSGVPVEDSDDVKACMTKMFGYFDRTSPQSPAILGEMEVLCKEASLKPAPAACLDAKISALVPGLESTGSRIEPEQMEPMIASCRSPGSVPASAQTNSDFNASMANQVHQLEQSASSPQGTPVASPEAQASTVSADGPAANRCGWIENDMPSSLSLQDRDGTWQIVGGAASGEPAGFDQMPPTNNGDSCGCLTVETNRQTMQVVKILGGSIKPISACQNDKHLSKQ